MAEAFVFVLVLLVGLVGSFVLYMLVRAEHDNRETMNRETAEQAARRDKRNQK